jgi:arginine/lysine/ornithine decarboxylase
MTTGINIKTEASKELLETINSLVGQRAEDNIYVYPPGSYIVTRGELITKEKAYILTGYAQSGKLLRGI